MTTKPLPHQRGFRITPFENRTGTRSFRVIGWMLGRRIRENHASLKAAEARRLELENERLGHKTAEVLRATWLTGDQLRAAETVFASMPDPEELRRATDWWRRHGKELDATSRDSDGIGLDEAVGRFLAWLEATPSLRPATRRNLRYRVQMFASEVGNLPMATLTAEVIEKWLDGRKVGPVTKANDLRAISRFFAWCCERRQRFLTSNPCAVVEVEQVDGGTPEIYSNGEVMRLLTAARRFRGGRFLKFVVLQLFGGLRPMEAIRFQDAWLVDGRVRIDKADSKTGQGRTFDADPVLMAWLKVCGDGPVADPQKSKLLWGGLKETARLNRWIPDGLRHTAVSHFFRRCGAYGLTAEWAGNSEGVIKAHYQARTSTQDTAAFWNLYPDRKDRVAGRIQPSGSGVRHA